MTGGLNDRLGLLENGGLSEVGGDATSACALTLTKVGNVMKAMMVDENLTACSFNMTVDEVMQM